MRRAWAQAWAWQWHHRRGQGGGGRIWRGRDVGAGTGWSTATSKGVEAQHGRGHEGARRHRQRNSDPGGGAVTRKGAGARRG